MKNHVSLCLLILSGVVYSSPVIAGSYFVGYEFGEMSFNKFKHFAGEFGYQLHNKHTTRLAFVDVALSERHLSSSEASAVNGENVVGRWKGLDIYYDFPVTDQISIGPSIGYHDTEYRHTQLNQSVRNRSTTAGLAVSYKGEDVLGFTAFYWKFSLTFRHYFNALEKTNLGDAVVNGGSFETVPLIFVGYKF